jgi:hypothetical protein
VIARYFSDWKSRNFECACGWSGRGDELATEPFAELVEGSCPTCGTNQVVVEFPSRSELEAAAAAGNEEARRMLGWYQLR